jgi:parallel beta-helix repeat protein
MRKSLLMAFLIAIIISGLTLAGTVHFSTVHASTEVTGVISSDTTWTKANSPYIFTAPVLVNNNVTLTIQAGVTVYFNGNYLRVNGTLNARGTTDNRITFIINGSSKDYSALQFTSSSVGWDEQTNSGSIIENTIINATWGDYSTILIQDASPKINNNYIINEGNTAIQTWSELSVASAGPIISNNSIKNSDEAISLSTNATVSDNTIYNCGTGISAYVGSRGFPSVYGNTIYGCERGIWSYDSNMTIYGNLIINNAQGMEIGHYDVNNLITPVPVIMNNTLSKNSVGFDINGDLQPVIMYNNIQNSSQYNMYLEFGAPWSYSSSDINAIFNWWGTTDTQTINQTIRDFKNDFNLGIVDFVPFLTELNPAAPTIPTFTITASAGAGGSISPSGSVNVAYGDDQTFTVTPNSGYQVASVLMDGVPATAPYTFTNVIADGHTISATFEPIPTSTPTPTPSPSPSPTPTPTPTSTPTSTQISLSVDASSTAVGSAVNINGKLSDSNGNPLQDKSVTLSYVVTDSTSWVPIGSGITNSAGEYNIQWVNTASGTFTLKAEWNGNDEYLGASATTTLSFLPYENQQVFFVESNSTVSALAFNSTSSELSFAVSGTSGTTGYVKVTIAKSLVSNAENIKVYLDGNQLHYEVTSNADSWLLTFTYQHSTHEVMISLATNGAGGTLLGIEYLILIAVVIVIAVAGAVGFIVWRKKKKP